MDEHAAQEAAWARAAAPYRRTLQAITAPATTLRVVADDGLYWACLRELSSLPSCATFHPLAATAQWTVELGSEESRHGSEPRAQSGFEAHLTDRARRRQQLAVLPPSEARSGQTARTAARPPLGRAGARNDESDSSEPIDSRTAALASGVATSGEQGAWIALMRIAQLVQLVEGASRPDLDADERPAAEPAGSRSGQRRISALLSRTGQPAVSTSGPAANDSASEGSGIDAPASAGAFSPQGLLASYTSVLFEAREATRAQRAAPPRSQPPGTSSPQPAARAPSLLLPHSQPEPGRPQDMHSATASAHAEARPPRRRDDAESTSAPEQDDEDVAAQINRALIEQAWLRGVDLT